jgi:hypothetical protein
MQLNPYLTSENFYSQKYRILKTVLLVFAWLTLGCNQELPRVVLEDLKILLDTNYYYISLLLIIRSCGILLVTVFIGIIYDKFTGYSDTIISLGNFILITSEFLSLDRILEIFSFQSFFNLSQFHYAMDEELWLHVSLEFHTGLFNSNIRNWNKSNDIEFMAWYFELANKCSSCGVWYWWYCGFANSKALDEIRSEI